jgi:hypothetical protein
MAIPSYKDYKNNLEIIGENKLVSIIDENRLGVDDRYFNYYRTSYCIDEIINIVDKSFRALFLNLDLKVKQKVDDVNNDILFINGSIENFHHFAINNFVGEKDKERIINLIKDYTCLIKEIQNKKDNEVIDIPSDFSDDNDIPLLNDNLNDNSFKSRLHNAKKVLNNFFQRANLFAKCVYRRVKYGITYCVNSFIENYRR